MNLEEEITKFRAKKKGQLAESVTENANEDGTQPVETADGRVPNDDGKKIGTKEIHEAQEILNRYKQGKANLEKRIISNEQWWKMRHWGELSDSASAVESDPLRPRPVSAWLFNSLANKHADAMDNYPEPTILPRELSDEQTAQTLSDVLPVVLEHNDYEQTYSDGWWQKLKGGSMCQAVLWNSRKDNGIGDIDICNIDLLNLYWESGISDIQKSPNLFYLSLEDTEALKQRYPEFANKSGGDSIAVSKYKYDDNVDTSEKSTVVDWYYKVWDGTKCKLHYCKFCGDTVLYASENDPEYADRGFYDHGEYPFVIDTMFRVEGSPCGFGYIDIMKDCQMYIDKLNQVVLEHTVKMTNKRYFVKMNGNVNEGEFADQRKRFVHVQGNLTDEDIREIKVEPLDSAVMNVLQLKIDELKETSGNRDFSQGGTSSGITAASAIAALQEAGSKLSRDMLKSTYNAYTKVCYFAIELMRQFYDTQRYFRITGKDGSQQFVQFDNSGLIPQSAGSVGGFDLGERTPIFDIVCKASRRSPFSKAAQNELAKELFGAGFFNPQLSDQVLACLDMMDFDGKQEVVQRVQQNGTMYQQIMQLQQQVAQLQAIITGQMPQQIGTVQGAGQPMPSGQAQQTGGDSSQLAKIFDDATENSIVNKAREKAQNVTNISQ